jgi:histidine triad (HIT) family protein
MLFPYQLLYFPVLSSFRRISEQLRPKRLKAVELKAEKVYNNNMRCIFCDIIERKKPAKVYLEDENIIVFADILPRAAIHLLISPKRHFRNLNDVPDDLLLKMLQTARTIAKELSIGENFRLTLNNGARAGQIVEHIHFHFMSNASGIDINYI